MSKKKLGIKEESKVVGWICPVCCSVVSPYEKVCANPACRMATQVMVESYFAVNKEVGK